MQIDNMLRKTSPGSRDIMSAIFNTDYTKKVLINILTIQDNPRKGSLYDIKYETVMNSPRTTITSNGGHIISKNQRSGFSDIVDMHDDPKTAGNRFSRFKGTKLVHTILFSNKFSSFELF